MPAHLSPRLKKPLLLAMLSAFSYKNIYRFDVLTLFPFKGFLSLPPAVLLIS